MAPGYCVSGWCDKQLTDGDHSNHNYDLSEFEVCQLRALGTPYLRDTSVKYQKNRILSNIISMMQSVIQNGRGYLDRQAA